MEHDIFIAGASYELRDRYARELGHSILRIATRIAKRENPTEYLTRVEPHHVHTAMVELISKVIE